MRIPLHRFVSALGDEAIVVGTYGLYDVWTDEARERLTKAGFRFAGQKPYKWDDVGGLTFDYIPRRPEQILEVDSLSWVCFKPVKSALAHQKQLKIKNEWDYCKAAKIIEEDTPRQILNDPTEAILAEKNVRQCVTPMPAPSYRSLSWYQKK